MMMAGTDAGRSSVPYGEWHARELECMMTYIGMTSMEAIRSATANAAYAMNMQDKIGTIEVGKLADLLVVIGDPLANIQVLQDKANLEVIMKDGSIVRSEEHTSELQSLMRISYAAFCLKKQNKIQR